MCDIQSLLMGINCLEESLVRTLPGWLCIREHLHLVQAASWLVCCWVEAPSFLSGLPHALGFGASLLGRRLSQQLNSNCL